MTTVIEILKQHLVDNGFDGLVNGDYECGCELSDLQPCDLDFAGCKPGYKADDPEIGFRIYESKEHTSYTEFTPEKWEKWEELNK